MIVFNKFYSILVLFVRKEDDAIEENDEIILNVHIILYTDQTPH